MKVKDTSLKEEAGVTQSTYQYILPEKSAQWANILRLEWSRDQAERPKFLEEMTREQSAEEQKMAAAAPVAAEKAASISIPIPPALKAYLGEDDPKTNSLYLYASETGSLTPFLAQMGIHPESVVIENNTLTQPLLQTLVRKSLYPVMLIDLRGETPTHIGARPSTDRERGYPVFVLAKDSAVPALLVKDLDTHEFLQKEDLPEVLKAMIGSLYKIFMKTK
jgi:hypothetical protein